MKKIDNSRLRREAAPEKGRECLCLLGLGVVVFVFGFIFAWEHFQCVRLGYQIEQLKQQRADMEERNHQLSLLQASLADPQRIDKLAREKLGLAPPGPEQVIPVSDGVDAPAPVVRAEFARNFPGPSGDSSGEE